MVICSPRSPPGTTQSTAPGNIAETHEGNLAFLTPRNASRMLSDTLLAYCKFLHISSVVLGKFVSKDRFIKTPEGEAGLNYLCSGLKAFIAKPPLARGEIARRFGQL